VELDEVEPTSMTAIPAAKTGTEIAIGTNAQPRGDVRDLERDAAGSLDPDLGTETGKELEGRGRGTGRGSARNLGTAIENANADEADLRVSATETAAAAKTEAGVSLTWSRTSPKKRWTTTSTATSRSSRRRKTASRGSTTVATGLTTIIEFGWVESHSKLKGKTWHRVLSLFLTILRSPSFHDF